MKKFYQMIPREFENEEVNRRFQENIPSYDQLGKEIEELETKLVPLNSPIVFCHNDLSSGNIVYDEQTDIAFIDFDETFFNYQGFDIGNHFCEFAGVHVMDFDNYPQKEFQLKWLKSTLAIGIHSLESTKMSQTRTWKSYTSLSINLPWLLIFMAYFGV
ncbi:ethanolamine kinase 1-like isoform X2 [Ptychodera flava]|uniref:ethanolamine kinase 1-like isoform X2 n=1 Tax=Ptychodera flava TaxID=63121 RepID=UPI00396A3536